MRHVHVVIGVNRRLASQRCSSKLRAAIRNHLIHIHVELRPAARHPDMQRKHVVMPAGKNLITDLDNQVAALLIEPLLPVVDDGGGFLEDGVRIDHLARHQIGTNAEMLERTLRLCTPEFAGRNIDFAQTVGFFSNIGN